MRAFRGWFTQNKMLAIPALVGFAIWLFIAAMVLLGGCATATPPAADRSPGPYDPVDRGVTTTSVQLPDGTTVQCVIYDPVGSNSGGIWCK